MTVGTVFTLFVVPVFYMLIAAEHRAEVLADDVAPQREVGPRAGLVEA